MEEVRGRVVVMTRFWEAWAVQVIGAEEKLELLILLLMVVMPVTTELPMELAAAELPLKILVPEQPEELVPEEWWLYFLIPEAELI